MQHVHRQGFNFESVLIIFCFDRTLWDLSPSFSSFFFFFKIRTGLCLQLSALPTYFLPKVWYPEEFFHFEWFMLLFVQFGSAFVSTSFLKILSVSVYLLRVQFMSKIRIFLRNTFVLINTSQSASQTLIGNMLKIFESSLLRKSISH